mgnify:CR=1 FL=1
MNNKTNSYQLKLWLPISSFIIFASLLASIIFFNYRIELDLLHQQTEQKIQSEMERLQLRLEVMIPQNESNNIERELNYINLMPETEVIALIDTKGEILFANDRRWKNKHVKDTFPEFKQNISQLSQNNFQVTIQYDKESHHYFVYTPIALTSSSKQLRLHQVGVLYFIYDNSLADQAIWRNTFNQSILSSISVIVAMLILLIIQHITISNPLKRLIRFTEEIGEGDFSTSNPLFGKGELMLLGETLERTSQLLEQREQNLSVTLNSIGDAVITTDDKGCVTRMNPIAEQLTGWQLSEAKGISLKSIFPIIDASTREPIANPVDKVISTGETVYLSNHTTLIAKDKTEYQIADSAAPIRDAHNTILGMILVFNDVTERYRIRLELNRSLQRLSLHWKDTPLGMVEWNTDFEFIDLNPAAEQMFGFKKAEIQGQHITKNILPESAREAVDKVWAELLANTGGRRSLNENITKDGRTILCEWYNTPLIDDEGIVIGVSSLVMDITEQQRLAKQEQGNKTQLQEVLNSMLTMVATLLPDGSISFINTPPLRISGLTRKEVFKKKIWNGPWFSYNNALQQMIKNDCHRAAAGETINREIEIAVLNGLLWIDFSVHPVFDKQGKITSLVAEGRDISRRKLAEEHAIRSQKMEALSKIVGGIAHDYNNMLGVITGYTGLLKRKYQDVEGTEKFISEIIHATDRGKKLTQKMLNFSRPESSHAEPCNMNQVLESFHDILEKSLTAVITLKFNLNKEGWMVWLDVGELEDAILNMAINAKFAMPEGGSLTISTHNIQLAEKEAKYLNVAPNDYFKLTIEDTGSGIEQAVQDKIFDPFFSTKGEAGNGLGLSQVFGFIERVGGAINVYSQVGKGTQFTLYFPRYHQVIDDFKKMQTTKVEPKLSGNETILVVDDEPALRELARHILLDAGYKVLTASDGKEALNILPTQTIDLVLSDVIMPNMDGYQLAQKILDHYPKVKIQLTSGFSGERHNILKDSKLKDNMLYKPYDSHELLTHIRLILDGFILPKGEL